MEVGLPILKNFVEPEMEGAVRRDRLEDKIEAGPLLDFRCGSTGKVSFLTGTFKVAP